MQQETSSMLAFFGLGIIELIIIGLVLAVFAGAAVAVGLVIAMGNKR